jgi:hypothetical protein
MSWPKQSFKFDIPHKDSQVTYDAAQTREHQLAVSNIRSNEKFNLKAREAFII